DSHVSCRRTNDQDGYAELFLFTAKRCRRGLPVCLRTCSYCRPTTYVARIFSASKQCESCHHLGDIQSTCRPGSRTQAVNQHNCERCRIGGRCLRESPCCRLCQRTFLSGFPLF